MITLREIAALVGGELSGDGDLRISSVADISEADSSQLTFVSEEKHLEAASASKAAAFLIKRGLKLPGKSVIEVGSAHLAVAKVLEKISSKTAYPKGVHHSAVVSRHARLGKDVSIMPFTVIEDGAEIGDETVIMPFTYVGKDTKIGRNCLLYTGVTVRERITIGNNVIIHGGAVIGADGFGYTKLDNGRYYKIPQTGTVVIEDDVEIGANSCIDRAMLSKTVIGRGTKIDNLVQVAHNVKVGEDCVFAAQCAIAGTCHIKKGVVLAGQVGIADHVNIGENAVVLAQSGVSKDIPDNKVYWGYPADEVKSAWRALAELRRMPVLIEKVKNLEIRLEEMEKRLNK